MNPPLSHAARPQALRALGTFGIALAGVITAAAVLVPAAPATAQSAVPNPFLYTFNSAGTLREASSPANSTSPYFWLAEGDALVIKGGRGQTLQGAQKRSGSAVWSDSGTHPQNSFLMLTKQALADGSVSAYFDRIRDNLSNAANRHAYNGESVIARYQDGNDYYYAGIRADGNVVIKRKVNGSFTTLAVKKVLPGTWSASGDADLIPLNKWVGLKLDVTNTSKGQKLSLYTDIGWTGRWTLAASALDSDATLAKAGTAGIESTFGDLVFDNFETAASAAAASSDPVASDPAPAESGTSSTKAGTAYDATILAAKPVLYLAMDGMASGHEQDLSGNGHTGTYKGGTPSSATLPNGDTAADFNGTSQYLTVPSDRSFSIPATGALTWEGWVRADTFSFPKDSDDGYVDWMGKCEDYSPSCEWEARIYGSDTAEGRPERLSAYVFNPSAGLGSAADWQPSKGQIASGEWVYVVAEYQTKTTPSGCSSQYPGSISIWVDGVKQSFADHAPTGCMSQYKITPKAGGSPLDIGTMAMDTFFKGAVGKVAVYDRLLSQSEIDSHFEAMTGTTPGGSCGETCSLLSSITSLLTI
ncbi:MAG TPA: LamG-like jellyroll fold domain-containing protein [Candidatus Paceibacterota bacterium]|nr:LamG-like jellyroll fold domain-containing protein [Candidatus Paceibacterota bacterium]